MDGRQRPAAWRGAGMTRFSLADAAKAQKRAQEGGFGRVERPQGRAAKAQATSISPKSFYGLPAVPEHKFHPTRRWRFDWAFPEAKLALEIEGGQWVQGRHNRGAGQIADLAKYSEAAILGWRIVYATPAEVKNGTALDRVMRALGQ